MGNLILHMCAKESNHCMFTCAIMTLDEPIFIVLSHFFRGFICLLGGEKTNFQKMKMTFLTESYYINVYQIIWSLDVESYDLERKIFIILVIFNLFTPKRHTPLFWQVEQITLSHLIPCMCTRCYNHWICIWVVMAANRHIPVILVISDLLIPLAGGKIKFSKNFKKSGDNLIPFMRPKYYNHWMCGWVVMATDGHISITVVCFGFFVRLTGG